MFAACGLLSVVCCWGVCCLLFVVLGVGNWLFAVCCCLFVARCFVLWLFVTCRRLFVYCLLFFVYSDVVNTTGLENKKNLANHTWDRTWAYLDGF